MFRIRDRVLPLSCKAILHLYNTLAANGTSITGMSFFQILFGQRGPTEVKGEVEILGNVQFLMGHIVCHHSQVQPGIVPISLKAWAGIDALTW